jgi:hypothetical protein
MTTAKRYRHGTFVTVHWITGPLAGTDEEVELALLNAHLTTWSAAWWGVTPRPKYRIEVDPADELAPGQLCPCAECSEAARKGTRVVDKS